MGGITSATLLDHLYNKKLPQVYRDRDSEILDPELNYPLKRYLESLIEGGFCGSIGDIENMMLLVDPKNIPEEYFPYLYKSLGLEYFPDIDITYQRKFLMNIGEIVKRRGTFSCVSFIIRVLTGLDAELSVTDNTLNIVLLAKNLEELNSIDTSMEVIKNFIKTQIPYYIDIGTSSKIATQVIRSKSHSLSAISTNKSYTINRYKEGN